ncbi:TolC family protein [Chitinophaga lutea]
MASWKSTLRTIKLVALLWWLPAAAQAQTLPLDSVLARIDGNNLLLQSYPLRAQAFKNSAEAATAWMAPMIGAGTFMTPYPRQEVMDERDKGSLMLQLEQDIPNPAKQQAKKKYIASQGDAQLAARGVTYNDLRAQAKRLYFSWANAERRIRLLEENGRLMETMRRIEQLRYPYNQSQLGNVYKADARIEENRNMMRMQEGTIAKSRAWLNSLMNRPGNESFEIDTAWQPAFEPAAAYDTASLAIARQDVQKMDAELRTMRWGINSMRKEAKPDFRVRFDHMQPLGSMMPKAFSAMGMISFPIAPWASKMYKSEIRAMEQNAAAMEMERAAMLVETQGMLYGMQHEISSMQQRIVAMEGKVVPALQRSLETTFLQYQENRLALPAVIDAWEALTMMQLTVLDEKEKRYEMIVEYEKALYR